MKTTSKEEHLYKSINSLKQIQRIDGKNLNSRIFARKYRKNGVPVVITGLLNSMNSWDLDFLCENLGNQKFPFRVNGWKRFKQEKHLWNDIGSGVESRSLSFNEYVDLLSSKEAHNQDIYLGRCALKNTPLANSVKLIEAEAKLGFKMPATSFNLWVAPGNHTAPLHYDPMDGTLIQMYGVKRVVLFPPSQIYNLYPISLLKCLRNGLKIRASYSKVYPENPDFVKFPKFKQALSHRYEVILKQGDILFIPAGWWHEVTCNGDGVVCSINRFWHVFPLTRAITSWNKWRLHLSALMAAPHIIKAWLEAILSKDREQKLRHLVQRL
ncbi:MAG: cupin-like domain-containing protein [Cyanobacteria bacterium J06643_5]